MAAPSLEHERTDRADPAHVVAVVEAARAASADGSRPSGRTVVVAVDGRSGSGKTLLGTAVAAALGCPVVHLDDVYPGWDGLAEGVALLTTDLLEPVSRGRGGQLPPLGLDALAPRPRRARAGPADVLVVEGCGVLVEPGGQPRHGPGVGRGAPTTSAAGAALARDGETYAPHWDRWAAQEELVYASGPWADARTSSCGRARRDDGRRPAGARAGAAAAGRPVAAHPPDRRGRPRRPGSSRPTCSATRPVLRARHRDPLPRASPTGSGCVGSSR